MSRSKKTTAKDSASTHGIIAVPDYKSDLLTGAILWWHLESEVPIDDLKKAWVDEGLDEKLLPKLPSPGHALHHTAKKLSDKRRLARPLEGKKGWALVAESAKGDDLDYGVGCRLKLDATDNVSVEPPDHPLAKSIQSTFDHFLKVYIHIQISGWLTDLVRMHRAVSLRETGGIYFIPKDQVEKVKEYVAVLHSVSPCRVYEVPAMRSEEAVEAILAAVQREADVELAEMEKALAEADLGERALRGREARCQTMMEHVASYEELLGKNLDALKERIDGLKANIVQAALAASAEEDKAAVA